MAEKVGHADLPDLRLACKALYAAVGDAGLALRPNDDILPEQLRQLCTIFPKATSLYIPAFSQLKNQSLAYLQLLAPSLKHLKIDECYWLKAAGAVHLTALSSLETLVIVSPNLKALPSGLSALKMLQHLEIYFCEGLKSISDFNICTLATLQNLGLHTHRLKSISEEISSLTNLIILNLTDSQKLRRLPDGISALQSMRALRLRNCTSLLALPESIGALTGLQLLDIKGCSSLTALPPGFGSLVGLQEIGAGGKDCIAALTALLESLRSCRAVGPPVIVLILLIKVSVFSLQV